MFLCLDTTIHVSVYMFIMQDILGQMRISAKIVVLSKRHSKNVCFCASLASWNKRAGFQDWGGP